MTNLSPAAQAVLTALTQQEYGLDPADIPNEAGRMACVAAAALRAAVDQVLPIEHEIIDNCWYEKADSIREKFLAIAAELEGA